jgi:hypothetical protein
VYGTAGQWARWCVRDKMGSSVLSVNVFVEVICGVNDQYHVYSKGLLYF